ncbi:transposase [bacterium AH-315-E10]|nr:transposase [bacterium AH-315-E10]
MHGDVNIGKVENLRLYRWNDVGGTFFVTKCIEPKTSVLLNDVAQRISDGFKYYAQNGDIKLAAFVVMPDHWHALFGLSLGDHLPNRMRTMSNWFSRCSSDALEKSECSWQDGYYDVRIRSTKQFLYIINYIEQNPTSRELVVQKEDWCWSSANEEYIQCLTRPWPWPFEQDT